MIFHFFKTAWRYARRQKLYTLINLAGLSVGLASALLIAMWVVDELGYDRFHARANAIIRVSARFGENAPRSLRMPAPLGPAILQAIPGVEEAARFRPGGRMLLRHDRQAFYEEGGVMADESFFHVFSFPFIQGAPETAFPDPLAIIITQSMARKYFGDADPIGQTLKLENALDFHVTAVLADVPRQSHLQFDFILSMAIMGAEQAADWSNRSYFTYLLLEPGADRTLIPRRIDELMNIHPELQAATELQPLKRIHLFSDFSDDMALRGSMAQVRLYALIGTLILIIAGINFVNLSTSRSEKRRLEVGLRKVTGARREQLVIQFLGEAVLTTWMSLALALLLAELATPLFNQLTGKELILWNRPALFFAGLGLFTLAIGLCSGIYPAIYLSSFHPSAVLKKRSGRHKMGLRNALVTVQFAASVFLLIATAAIFRQLKHMETQNTGLTPQRVITMPMRGALREHFHRVRQTLLSHPAVASVSGASALPVNFIAPERESVKYQGAVKTLNRLSVDANFFSLLNVKIDQGRGFESRRTADSAFACLINQAAATDLGITQPEGSRILHQGVMKNVIGIVNNFHYKSLHSQIDPLIITLDREFNYLLVKSAPGQTEAAVSRLETLWTRYNPGYPPEYHFLEDEMHRQYAGDRHLSRVSLSLSILALFVASLGLVGLMAFLIEQKTKEVGIRKVLGASNASILALLSRSFLKWVILANILAWPLACILIHHWQSAYASQASLGWEIYVLSSLIPLFLAGVILVTQSMRAVKTQAADALRYE